MLAPGFRLVNKFGGEDPETPDWDSRTSIRELWVSHFRRLDLLYRSLRGSEFQFIESKFFVSKVSESKFYEPKFFESQVL